MPFCTTCGANVTGAFCSQCGTPAAGAAASTSPPAAAPYQQAAAPGAVPVARKTSPIVWVLIIVLGMFVLGGIGLAAFVAFVGHRMHQAGVSFDRGRDGGVTFQTHDRDGKNAVVQFGGKGKLPSWVPVYPGSDAHATFSVTGTADNSEGGNFTFTTSDDPGRVKSFYSDKAKLMGMTISVDTTTPEGGMLVAADDGADQRSLTVVIGGHLSQTTVNVSYGRK
jgi:hypothetical protein